MLIHLAISLSSSLRPSASSSTAALSYNGGGGLAASNSFVDFVQCGRYTWIMANRLSQHTWWSICYRQFTEKSNSNNSSDGYAGVVYVHQSNFRQERWTNPASVPQHAQSVAVSDRSCRRLLRLGISNTPLLRGIVRSWLTLGFQYFTANFLDSGRRQRLGVSIKAQDVSFHIKNNNYWCWKRENEGWQSNWIRSMQFNQYYTPLNNHNWRLTGNRWRVRIFPASNRSKLLTVLLVVTMSRISHKISDGWLMWRWVEARTVNRNEWKRIHVQQKSISDGRWGGQGSVGGENENYSRSIICHHKIKKRIRMVNVKVGWSKKSK